MPDATRLLLMRHAKSDWYSGAGADFLRPLSDRGIRDARRMGQWLAASGHLPERIVSSPSRRTRQTLELLAEGAGTHLLARTDWHDELYHASSATLLSALAKYVPGNDLLVLGHNPGMEELVAYLLGTQLVGELYTKLMPTAAVYVLEVVDGLTAMSAGCARLLAHQRPKSLAP